MQKNQKNFEIWKKLQNLMKEYIFEKKKRFHPFQRYLLQNWWAENMPVVAGRLVLNPLRICMHVK